MKMSQMRAKARGQFKRGVRGAVLAVVRGRAFTMAEVVIRRTKAAQAKWDVYRRALRVEHG
jgi:hypothetical protein